jgi:hypothetical protein
MLPDTASPNGPDPEGPDALDITAPGLDGQGLSPPHPVPVLVRPETQQSSTQNPMTPASSDPGRRTPTSPIRVGPSDPIPDLSNVGPHRRPDEVEIPTKPEVPPKPRRDVAHTEPARAGQTVQPSKKDGARVVGTKPTTKSARSKREIKHTPPTQHR